MQWLRSLEDVAGTAERSSHWCDQYECRQDRHGSADSSTNKKAIDIRAAARSTTVARSGSFI
jgi:hypothetical protein